MKIAHVITGLNNGGAEAVLYRLCVNDTHNQHVVISMMNLGKYGLMLQDAGITVFCLNMPKSKVTLSSLKKLYFLLKKTDPDVVQTWMYHADLIGGIVARLVGIKNVVWNIRNTTLEKNISKKSTILIAKTCALLSFLIPKNIICCANKALEVHSELGYKIEKMHVVGNGYELNLFEFSSFLAKPIIEEFKLESVEHILGMVGRYDPVKDHNNLLESLALVKKTEPRFKCLLVGRQLNSKNSVLIENINRLKLHDNILLLDQRTDIPSIMNTLDIHVLSSISEGFPNVIAEAMACGTPCVTTDVGDAALIIGKTGWIVPPNDPASLSVAILSALNLKKDSLLWNEYKVSVRKRVEENFDIKKMVDSYNNVWKL